MIRFRRRILVALAAAAIYGIVVAMVDASRPPGSGSWWYGIAMFAVAYALLGIVIDAMFGRLRRSD